MAASGTPGSAKANNWMVTSIYTACALSVLLFVASVFLVLDYSVYQANSFGVAQERKLVQQEFQHQIDEVVKYQAEVSFWDPTVAQIRAGSFNKRFVEKQLHDWLWSDFGFSWVVFADQGRTTTLAVNNGISVATDKADNLLFWIDDLLFEANQNYAAALIPVEGGFQVRTVKSDRDQLAAPLPYIHAADMRMVDGMMSIVVVQAVVPKSLFIPEKFKKPTLMVTVKPISTKMMAAMDARLAIGGLHVVPGSVDGEAPDAYTPVGKGFTDGPFVVAWTPNAPGPFIWTSAAPKLAIFSLLAALALGFIAWRFSIVVHALQKSEASNRFLAKHDALTGLANRIGFDEAMKRAIDRGPQEPFAVLAIDLDKFKAVNDQHGHGAGDAVLRALAVRFMERVGSAGFVARIGGDEFMVLLPQTSDHDTIMAIANGLVIDAQIPILFEDFILRVGGSAGVASFPAHGRNARDIMHAADLALYEAKNNGRNRAILSGEPANMPRHTAAA